MERSQMPMKAQSSGSAANKWHDNTNEQQTQRRKQRMKLEGCLKGETTTDDTVKTRRLYLLLRVGLTVAGVEDIVQIHGESEGAGAPLPDLHPGTDIRHEETGDLEIGIDRRIVRGVG
jgi:hypothetical protein